MLRGVALAFALLVAVAPIETTNGEQLCSLPPITYAEAKTTHPEAAFALSELETRGIATWYSDREENGDYVATAKQLVSQCPQESRLSVVVYGLPNKDCEAGYSNSGSRVKSAYDYEQFIQTLSQIIGQRKVLYVLEPDAVGLLAKSGGSGCAAQSGYKDNLKTAIRILSSSNPNADIYLDVGYWTLGTSESTRDVADVVRELGYAGKVKGITLNTSNYRSNDELAQLCSNFQRAMGYNGMNCIIDTSRNYRGSASSEWCNLRSAGIGKLPTKDTGYPNIDFFVWIKPPGDSDGTCAEGSHTWEAMAGPGAGVFFEESFKLLWNQGSLVQELQLPKIDGTVHITNVVAVPTPVPSPTAPTAPSIAETVEPTPELLEVQKLLLEAALKDMLNNGSTSGEEAGLASLESSGSGSLAVVESGSSASSAAEADVVSTNGVLPSSAPSLVPSPTPSLSSPSSSRPELERKISTRATDGVSAGTKVGVILTLFGAGIATAIGVMLFVRSRGKKLEEQKSPNLSYLPVTPH